MARYVFSSLGILPSTSSKHISIKVAYTSRDERYQLSQSCWPRYHLSSRGTRHWAVKHKTKHRNKCPFQSSMNENTLTCKPGQPSSIPQMEAGTRTAFVACTNSETTTLYRSLVVAHAMATVRMNVRVADF